MDFLKHKLLKRAEEGSLRSLSSFQGVDFWSNDYLGLAGQNVHSVSGGTGSRLISGNSESIESAEGEIAAFFGAKAALVFNSGYDANLGLFSSVPQRGDTILYDELIHASVRDGIRLSHATAFSFKHNDLADLRQRIEKTTGNVFVAVESLYSMDGDFAPLKALAELSTETGVFLIVDEAHAAGIYGDQGKGLCEQEGISDSCFARLVTFGKAYGSHGAAVLGDVLLRDYLINFARSFIYTTALPPEQYVFLAGIVQKDHQLARDLLRENISYYCEKTGANHHSPIQMLHFDDLKTCQEAVRNLMNSGFTVKAILPPTVPSGRQRIRICIHAFNTKEEIDHLLDAINLIRN